MHMFHVFISFDRSFILTLSPPLFGDARFQLFSTPDCKLVFRSESSKQLMGKMYLLLKTQI